VKKLDKKTGLLKLKATVVPAATNYTDALQLRQHWSKQDQYFGLSKSDCMKRGGKAVCHLEAALSAHGLEDKVAIKGTGCMKLQKQDQI